MRQECGNVLSLKDVPVTGFRYILDYLYTGTLEVKGIYIHDVLAAAQYLEVRDIEKACLDYQYYKGMSASAPISTHQLAPVIDNPAPVSMPPSTPSTDNMTYTPPMAVATQGQLYSSPIMPALTHSQLSAQCTTPSLHITPNLTFDTNYIEDYLKLIESMQGEQVTPQSSSHSPHRDYSRMPANYQDTTQYTSQYLPQTTHNTCVKSVGFPNVASHSGQFSAEDVRKTILSVLSQEKFDDSRDSDVSVGGHLTTTTTAGTLPSISQIVSQHRMHHVTHVTKEPPLLLPENGLEPPHAAPTHHHTPKPDDLTADMEEEEEIEEEDEEETQEIQDKEELVMEEVVGEVKSEPKDGVEIEQPSPSPPILVSKKDKRQKRKKKTPVKLNKQERMDSDEEQGDRPGKEEEEGEDTSREVVAVKRLRSIGRPRLNRVLRTERMRRRRRGMKSHPACDRCGRHFVKQEALNKHMLLHDQEMLYSCHVCGLKYARPGELTRHLRKHSVETYQCQDCAVNFKDPKEYKKHMQTSHGQIKAFVCSFIGCNFKADKPSNLEKHAAIHSDIKLYMCPKCGKSFAQPNGLRSHLRSCLQQRNYLCDICGSKFNHLQSLKSHRLLHTGEKPHTCKDCGARFTDHRNFKRHRRIHDNLFPYPCMHCEKSFRHSNSLKAHLKTHNVNPQRLANTDIREAIFAPPSPCVDPTANQLRDSINLAMTDRKLHSLHAYCPPEPSLSVNKA